MREIQLRDGHIAKVDDEDFARLGGCVMASYKTKGLGGYTANVNSSGLCWECLGGAHLGTITLSDGHVIGWAWRADGRSIDPHDRAFDLADFPQAAHLAETVAADG